MTPSRSSTSSHGRLGLMGKMFVVCFFLCGFPLLLIDGALSYLLEQRSLTFEEKGFKTLERTLRKVLSMREPEVLLRGTLEELSRRAEASPNPFRKAERLARKLVAAHPDLFSVKLFDGNGKLIDQIGIWESIPPAQALLWRLQRARRGIEPLDFRRYPGLTDYLGYPDPVERFNKLGFTTWMEVGRTSYKSYFFYHLGKEFSIFAHVHLQGFEPLLGLEKILSHFRSPGGRVDVLELETLNVIGNVDPEYRKLALIAGSRLLREPIQHLRLEGRLWSMISLDSKFSTDSRHFLLASRIFDPEAMKDENRRPFRWAAGLFFLAIWILSCLWFHSETAPFVSLRLKLVALFLLAGGLPLTILGFLTAAFVKEKEDWLRLKMETMGFRTLDTYERRYSLGYMSSERGFNRIIDQAHPETPLGFRMLREDLRMFMGPHVCRTIYILKADTHEIIFINRPGLVDPLPNDFVSRFLRVALCRMRGEIFPADTTFLRGLETRSEWGVPISGFEMLDSYLDHQGIISSLPVGQSGMYIMIRCLDFRENGPNLLIAGQWSSRDLQQIFLSRFFPMKPLDDGTELVLVKFNRKMKVVRHRERNGKEARHVIGFFPSYPKRPLGRDFLPLFHGVRIQGRDVSGRIFYKGQYALVCGRVANSVSEGGIFSITPLARITGEIRSMKFRILLFGGMILGFASLLGLILARKFLDPVRELASGMEAVNIQKFSYRIPPQDSDELGALTVQFNRMLEQLEEVSLAKRVQDGLLPKGSLEHGEYRIFGYSVPASDLGGDYFDYIVRPDNRLLVLQGDVTGHGIPAALIMAMVKGIVNHFAFSPSPPEDLLQALNGVIHRTANAPLFMTLGLLEIDVATNRATFFNFGNPLPLLLKKNREITPIEGKGKLMGFRSKLQVTPTSFEILPGERLVFYSDGLLETLEGKPGTAYSRFLEYIRVFGAMHLEEFCREVITRHPGFGARGAGQADDFTVLAVERRPAP